MNGENPLLQWAYQMLAALAGAVAALSFRPYESMGRGQIFMTLFVSASFAIFVGPLAVRAILGSGQVDMRAAGAILWLLATGANVLIPVAVRRVAGSFRGEP